MTRPDPLHVIVVTRSIAPLHGVGGLERHGHDLVSHLVARGVRVTLITRPPAPGAATARRDLPAGVRTVLVPYLTFPGAGGRGTTVIDRSTAYPLFGWRAGLLAARLVREGGVHIVHGMGAAVLGYAAAREADRLETVPLVLNPHGMEEFGSTGPGLGAAKRLAYAPLRSAVRRCARAADRVVATDRAMVPAVMCHLRTAESRVAVVPNAVDLERLDRMSGRAGAQDVRRRAGLRGDVPVMLAVGRLEPNKGFHVLIDAFRRVSLGAGFSGGGSRWRLVIVGDGSERQRLERECGTAGVRDDVVFAGRVSDDDLHAWYETARLFVHPSLYEGSSIVTLEAMAHGRAVVATTAGGLPDKVRPGLNGWLVAPGDPDALTAALRDAVACGAELDVMGRASRATVETEFSWTAVTRQVIALYEEVLTGSPTV